MFGPCLYSLVKTEANVWENSRADQSKTEMQSRVLTSSRILTNFTLLESRSLKYYFISVWSFKKEQRRLFDRSINYGAVQARECSRDEGSYIQYVGIITIYLDRLQQPVFFPSFLGKQGRYFLRFWVMITLLLSQLFRETG